MRRVAILLAAVAGLVYSASNAAAQIQPNNRQQNNGLTAGGFGAQQGGGLGNRSGGFGSGAGGGLGFGLQGGQGNQGGFLGQSGANQAQAGSAEAMRQSFENMGVAQQQQRQANFQRVIENLNQMRDSQGQGQGGGQQRNYAPVRVSIRPAFKLTPINPQVLEPELQGQLTKSLEISKSTATAQVTLNGQVATISGTVPDEHESKVLAKMMSLQPGVTQVENQLVVEGERGSTSELILPTPPPAR